MIRDRVKELRRVSAADLVPHPKNWRTHPQAQQQAIRGALAEIGYADAILTRELPDGRLQILDWHLRAETTPGETVPVLVLDLSEAEAEKLLATLDPLAAMAEADAVALDALLAEIELKDQYLRQMVEDLRDDAAKGGGGPAGENDAEEVLLDQAIQLRPEREYVVVLCDPDPAEWEALKTALDLQPVRRGGYKAGSPFDAIGTQRVIRAKDLLGRLNARRDTEQGTAGEGENVTPGAHGDPVRPGE